MPENLHQLGISPGFHCFLENLSELAGRQDRIPFIGREKEIEAVMESLLRKLKNNLLLIGKSGVGKTALITEIASRINAGKVPRFLKDKVILELSMDAFLYSRESVDVAAARQRRCSLPGGALLLPRDQDLAVRADDPAAGYSAGCRQRSRRPDETLLRQRRRSGLDGPARCVHGYRVLRV